MRKASRKVEEGKLVNVEFRYPGKIENIKIHGDFFISPPEALSEIEENLEGLKLDKNDLVNAVDSVNAELTGFSATDIAKAIIEAEKVK